MIRSTVLTFTLAACLSGSALFAHEGEKNNSVSTAMPSGDHPMIAGSSRDAGTNQAEWLAKAIAAYPLKTCVVSGDELSDGGMKPIDYIYKEDGKPDRLVRFCCKDCVRDFKKNPAKYLAKIDKAAVRQAKAAAQKPSGTP